MDNRKFNETVNGILTIFDHDTMCDLFHDIHDLFDTFNDDDQTTIQLRKIVGDDLEQVRVIRAAILISRLARKYNKKFKKVDQRFNNFDLDCESYVRRAESTQVGKE